MLETGVVYRAEVRTHQRPLCTGLTFLLEELGMEGLTVDITAIGDLFPTFAPTSQLMTLGGEARSQLNLTGADVAHWLWNTLRLFDVDVAVGQHWDAMVVRTDPGLTPMQWKTVSKSIPFVAFPMA